MGAGAGGQFDHIAIGIAKIDRANKAVIDRATNLSPFRFSFLQHALEGVVLNPQRNVQIQCVLIFEIEGRSRHLEKSKAGTVVHLKEGMERTAVIDFKGTDQTKTKEILVKGPRLLRIPTTIGVMVQTL